MSITAATVVAQFAADYFVVERLTPGRQHDVRRALAMLEAHAGGPPETLNERHVKDWVNALVVSGLHVNTVRKHLYAVKPFYKWAWRERIVDAERYHRILDVPPPRGSSGEGRPRPYKTREIHRFWDQLDARWPLTTERFCSRYVRGISPYRRVWTHAMHLQIQAVASLALFGGLRHSEIRNALMDDIHPDNEFIVVGRAKSSVGEGQGYREVPYTVEGRRMVGEWLAFREDVLRPTHDSPWLVVSATATQNSLLPSGPLEPIKRDGFKGLVTSVGAWELHRFRHTCGTEWLRAGVPLERVSKLLGHARLQQTQGYAEIVRDDVARDVRRAEADFLTAVGRRNALLVR
jgi:site-specific recombinase XerD